MNVIVEMQCLRDELLHRQIRHVRVRADKRDHSGDQQYERFMHANNRHAIVGFEILSGGPLQHIGYAVGDTVEKTDVQRGVAILDYSVREGAFLHDEFANELDEVVQRPVDVSGFAGGIPLLQLRENVADHIVENRIRHLVFIGKIVVEQGACHMCPVRDVADSDFGEALFGTYVACRAHDGCAPGIALSTGHWGITGAHSTSVRDDAGYNRVMGCGVGRRNQYSRCVVRLPLSGQDDVETGMR